MELNCEGCAGCCVDWRPLGGAPDHERQGRYRALDATYNLVPITRDEVWDFLDAGYGDALAPRLFSADDPERAVTVDGHAVAAMGDRPLFLVGLRKPPKPVAPFDGDRMWLDTCAFLDPETLQCRIHEDDLYPEACGTYPGQNLALDQDTECERVERAHGEPGERLRDRSVPEDLPPPAFGPQALGSTVFAYPDPADLDGVVARLEAGESTPEDRALFVGAAAGSAPGMPEVNEARAERAHERALEADSWVGRAAEEWTQAARAAGDRGAPATDAPDPEQVEEARGAPPTPGWDALRED
ncbi:YkgJ family cysteine cluster protein [Halorarum halophilum]|uniref:YkgJ family cysteine cluster protein n=1 Tax=Halorarum halophilum TaxID=2743090 RepID=A0A7D5KEL9_9EURY|nr:YkgJ family cysteine cluster protein [Halobaculum halophilum]QLG28357.1 YkgJ family cysteine cluster protein [Halobaculum halophilum]